MFTLHKNYPLEKLHSFNILTQAKYYVPIHSIAALQALVEDDIFHQHPPPLYLEVVIIFYSPATFQDV